MWQDAGVATALAARVEEAFREHRSFLWGLSYRLTGNAADAEDVVQETFVRALRRPPRRLDEAWRPWLVRVAVNLGRDLLRRRRRRRYDGPWLPSVLETEGADAEPADEGEGPAGRYDRLESVTFAFLLALEALTPAQRAVLLLRDVFDYSVREAGAALGMTAANVKTTHLRARRALRAYDRCRPPRGADHRARTGEALRRFLTCLGQHDVAGMETLLADDVRSLSDGGGEFHAARVPVIGRARVARFYLGVARLGGGVLGVAQRLVNGLPAVVVDLAPKGQGWARRVVIQCEIDEGGRIRRLYSVLATAKLTAIQQ
jgi:RNA polymerase sigma factor (sigma-70 family)